jgi:hypothetical protein
MTLAFPFLRPIRTASLLAVLVAALLGLTACDSGGSADEPPPTVDEPAVPAPVLTMSSVEVQLNNGDTGLQFFVRGDQDLSYRKVTIVPPPPFDDFVFNLGDTFVIAEESVALQDANSAYTKVNGTWTFTFDVTSGSGQDTKGHTIEMTLNVGGAQSAPLSKEAPLVRGL